eukprot:scaffold9498_cov90-Isochrysis_galbana.AAC.1
MLASPPATPSTVAQVSLVDFPPVSEVAVFNVVEGIAGSIHSHAGSAPSAAGGAFAGHGRQHGHIVCWRVQGACLELSEVSLVPGPADRAELSLCFPAALVPEVSLAQLSDDSLLLSAVTHAPAAGGHVFQLRFGRAEYAADGSPLARALWLAQPEPTVMTKFGYADEVVASRLGRLRLARFDSPREAGGAVTQLL